MSKKGALIANLPFMMQFFADPNVAEHLAMQEKTFDFMKWIKMVGDQQELQRRQKQKEENTNE